jgi:hypothetical protein
LSIDPTSLTLLFDGFPSAKQNPEKMVYTERTFHKDPDLRIYRARCCRSGRKRGAAFLAALLGYIDGERMWCGFC